MSSEVRWLHILEISVMMVWMLLRGVKDDVPFAMFLFVSCFGGSKNNYLVWMKTSLSPTIKVQRVWDTVASVKVKSWPEKCKLCPAPCWRQPAGLDGRQRLSQPRAGLHGLLTHSHPKYKALNRKRTWSKKGKLLSTIQLKGSPGVRGWESSSSMVCTVYTSFFPCLDSSCSELTNDHSNKPARVASKSTISEKG